MANRRYEGDPLDHRYQYITERPELDVRDTDSHADEPNETGKQDIVYVTDPEPDGEIRTENVPIPKDPNEDKKESPDIDEQTKLTDYY